MTYPLSSPVSEGDATEAAQYNNLRADALFLGADPTTSGTVRDLLFSSSGNLPLSRRGSTQILLSASEDAPAAVTIGGVIYSVTSDLVLSVTAVSLSAAGRYSIYAVASSGGKFTLSLASSSSARAIGSFVWGGAGIVPGTVHNLQETAVIQMINTPAASHGRLSLIAGDPVPDADITLGDTLYFLPYMGNRIGLYLFGTWEYFDFSMLSLGRSGLTAGIPYDIFLAADSDGLKLTAAAWSSVSTRGTGTLVYVDGVRVSGADSSRRYLGTVCLNSAGYFEDSRIGRLLWNENNRIARPIVSKLVTTKTQGTIHMNAWAPYYDEDAPAVRLLVPGPDCEFTLDAVGMSSPISETDRGYLRASCVGVMRDPMLQSPYTGNGNCAEVFVHSCGNGPLTARAENSSADFVGIHNYYLGFWSNYNFYPIGTSLKSAMGETPGISGKIMA